MSSALIVRKSSTAVASHSRTHYVHFRGLSAGASNHLRAQAMTRNVTESDKVYMARALELARTAEGKTHPNPAVGCVITRADDVVGEGFHPKAGEPHAEVFALRAAGQASRGGTAYVTLEPCNHFGRTPPCAIALIEAGISRVVVGVVDPNPLVGGTGIDRLLAAGILVDGPCLEQECFALNKDFMDRMAAQAADAK